MGNANPTSRIGGLKPTGYLYVNTMNQMFDFSDINLIPQKCVVQSRSEVDTKIKLGSYEFNLPVVPANMECVINDEIALKLAKANFFYIHHRFNVDYLQFYKTMKAEGLPTSISIGVNKEAYDTLKLLQENDACPDFITIDIAHGHSEKMEAILRHIKSNTFFSFTYVIAGNVSTAAATADLESWGADCIKVGIGPGSACTTYVATGFGSRGCQASVVQRCVLGKKKAATKIIADGGIKEPGDIAKAMVLGADLVMIGGMFSGLTDSPGNPVCVDGRLFKEFWGSASAASGKTERIEGIKKLIPLKSVDILGQMKHLTECLQSAVSYGGGKCVTCLKNVKFFCVHNN